MTSLLLKDIMTDAPVCIDQHSSAADALELMRQHRISAVVVVSAPGQAVGIVTERDAVLLAFRHLNPVTTPVADIMGKPPLSAQPEMDYQDGYRLLAQHGFRHLLVTDDANHLLGIATEGDFMNHLGNEFLVRFKDVGSLMTQGVLTMRPEASVHDALELMAANNISCVVVAEDNHPLGVFTERDLVKRYDASISLHTLPLHDVMVHPVTCIHTDQTLSEAMELMAELGIRRLLVTDHSDQITGLITRHDIVKQLYDRQVQHLRVLLEEREQELDQTRQELQREQQFRVVLERLNTSQQVASIGSWELDLSNNQLWWSEQTFRIFELSPLDFQPDYQNILQWIHPDDRAQFDDCYRRSLSCQTTLDYAFRIKTRHNTIRYLKGHFQTWLDDEYGPRRSIGTIQDVTEQHGQLEQHEHTTSLLQAVLHGSTDAIFVKDMQGRCLIGNQGLSDMLGLPLADIQGKLPHELFPAEVADDLTSLENHLIHTGQSRTFEEVLELQGESIPFLTTKGPVQVNGKTVGTFGIARDLRLVKQTEQERNQQSARLQAIFDTTKQLIGLMEPDGTVISLNKTAAHYFGVTQSNACGMSFIEHTWWSRDAARQSKIRLAIQQASSGQYVRYRVHLDQDGHDDVIDFSLSPVFDEQQQVHMLVAEGHIITKEVRAQLRLKESEESYRSFITHTQETVFSIEPEQPIPISLSDDEQIARLLSATVVTANLAMAKRYGYENPDDLLGLTIAQLHIQSGCTDEHFLQNWIESSYQFNGYISRSEDEQGISSWYSNNLTGVTEHGCLVRLWGTQTNITDRIMAEEAQGRSEELKRGVLNSIHAEIAVINSSGNIITANERWKSFRSSTCPDSCRLVCGHTGDSNYFDLLLEAAADRPCIAGDAYQGILSVMNGTSPNFTMEYPCDCETEQRWFHISVTPLSNQMVVITNTNITDRKFSELALKESEAHLQLALDAGDAGIWVWDIPTDKVFLDDRFAHFFGIQESHPISIMKVFDGIHPDDRDRANEDIDNALSGQGHYRSEYRVVSEGKVRWLSARGRIERNEQHIAIRFSGVVLDITERKHAEKKLQSEQDLHTQYLRTMQTLMVALDKNANIVMINRAACELLGYREGELIGRNWFESCLKEPEYQQEVMPVFRQIVNGSVSHVEHFENHIIDRHGKRHLIAWHNAVLRDADGRGTGVLSSGQDITEQRQTENALRDNEKTLSVIFEQAGVGVALVNSRTGQFLRINHKYCELLGYSEQELASGNSLWSIIHPDDLEQDQKQIQRLLDGSITHYSVEKRYIHRDGSIVWVSLTATSTWENSHDPRHHIAVVQDITLRKESEQKLQQAESDWIQAMDQFDDAFYLIDMNRHLIRANTAFYTLIGSSPEEAIDRPIHQLVHPHGEDSPCPVCQAQLENRETTVTLEIDDPNNPTDHPIEVALRLVHDSNDIPAGMLVAIRDLSHTRQIRERLRLAGIVFDNTTEGIMVTGADARVLEVNQAFTDILGYQRNEIIGQKPSILNSGQHNPEFYEDMWQSLENTGQWRGEIWNRRKDGSILPEWQTITRVDDELGNLAQYVAVFSDISQIKQSQEKLAHLAHHDPLTDLPNRLLLNERLERAISRAKRNNKRFTLMFLDIDNFKHINDSLGHPIGDQLLKALAHTLSSAVRCEDTVARVSGDEFVVILDQVATSDNASLVARKLIEKVAQPCHLGDREIAVTTSLGICIYPEDGQTPAELLRNADAAMYKAKANGRNTISFYNKSMTEEAFDRVMLENDLRQAIDRKELFLVYQPQIDLTTGLCIGAEVLLRWRHRSLGMISPARFIPIAEDSGLIHLVGEWVLRTACQQGAIWLEQGLNIGRLAVNIAGPQLQRGNLVELVRDVLDQTGFPPEHLELEVTEGYIMKQADQAIDCLHQLREMDITLAIDDFGTGHSSLSYLTQLPIHKLKIDQSFVRDMPENKQKMTITNTVIAMGKSLNLTVIAEGVETRLQADFLYERECHEVQGYLYSRPLETTDFQHYISEKFPIPTQK